MMCSNLRVVVQAPSERMCQHCYYYDIFIELTSGGSRPAGYALYSASSGGSGGMTGSNVSDEDEDTCE